MAHQHVPLDPEERSSIPKLVTKQSEDTSLEYEFGTKPFSDDSQSSQDQHEQIQARARSIRQRIYDRYNTIPNYP